MSYHNPKGWKHVHWPWEVSENKTNFIQTPLFKPSTYESTARNASAVPHATPTVREQRLPGPGENYKGQVVQHLHDGEPLPLHPEALLIMGNSLPPEGALTVKNIFFMLNCTVPRDIVHVGRLWNCSRRSKGDMKNHPRSSREGYCVRIVKMTSMPPLFQ